MIASLLTANGYEVLTAQDGAEALRLLLNKGAHIIISDWMMPKMDGLELCRAVRDNESIH